MKYRILGKVALVTGVDIEIEASNSDDAERIFWAMADNEPENLQDRFSSYLFNSELVTIDVELDDIDLVP